MNKPDTQKAHLDELIDTLRQASLRRQTMKDLLEAILTPGELAELPKRWQIIKMLQRKVPHRAIAKSLGIGVATVARGARELGEEKGSLQRALKVLKKK